LHKINDGNEFQSFILYIFKENCVIFLLVLGSDVVLKTGLCLKTGHKTIFWGFRLGQGGLGLEVLKSCVLKTKKVLRPFLDVKDLKTSILDEAKFQILRF